MNVSPSERRTPAWLRLLRAGAIAAAAVLLIALAACEDNGMITGDGTPTAGEGTPAAAGGSPSADATTGSSEVVLELTDDGFEPENVEVREGARVVIRNVSEEDRSVHITDAPGDDEDGEENDAGREIEVGAGESVELDLPRAGAYVVTVVDHPDLTASVIVS